MSDSNFYMPPGGPPPPSPRLRELYEKVGEDPIRELVSNFYDQIASSDILWMFPENLEESKVRSADFMVQVLGGPPYYVQKYGPPRMRARHLPFPIDEKARRVWLSCYRKAIKDWQADEESKEILWQFLQDFSSWMVNKASSVD